MIGAEQFGSDALVHVTNLDIYYICDMEKGVTKEDTITMDEINKRTGGERRRVDDFPKNYKPYVRDPNRVYKKRVGQMPNGKTYYFDDLTGERFGRLVVEKLDHIKIVGIGRKYYWVCKCDCGKITVVDAGSLKTGHTQSCGCYRTSQRSKQITERSTTHGLSHDPLYIEWISINRRCLNPKDRAYKKYSKYGICKEWRRTEPPGVPISNLEPFFKFKEWALANGYKKGLTIDRIKGWLGYSPDNCRWADAIVQSNNTSKNIWFWDGEEWLTGPMLCRKYGIDDVRNVRIDQKIFAKKGRSSWTIHELITWVKDKERDKLGKYTVPNADGILYRLSDKGREYDTIVLIHKVAPPPDGGPYIRKGYKPDGQQYKEG